MVSRGPGSGSGAAGQPNGKDHWAFQRLGPVAVPSVKDASRRLRDGALVEVDGDSGTVTVVG